MEVYSPLSDNLYENRTDFTLSVVNKRKNYENLQKSIQAHKNRLAMARMKKGKNLPNDDLLKYEDSGCCRQSTADTDEGFEQYRFRRHTQSSLNKVNKPIKKYNNLGINNSFDGKYDNEQMYIRRYDDFKTKIDQSLVKCHSKLQPKLSNKSDFSFDQDFGVNKVEISEDELEKKVVEILGKLLLNNEFKQNMGVLSQKQQQMQFDGPKVFQDENHGKMVDLLTKCISTTLNTAANDSLDNLSTSRTTKSVNVEINLNMPPTKETEPVVTVNMQDDDVEESSVFIENVFDKDTKIVKDNFLKEFFGKFKKLYSTDNKNKRVLKDKQTRMQLKTVNEENNKFVDKFQVNKVGNVVGVEEVQPVLMNEQVPFKTQVQNVVQKQMVPNFKNKQVQDLEEQKLWNMGEQIQMGKKNSFVGYNFRPFSRSRSQSVHMKQKVGIVRPQALPRNHSFFPTPGGKIVRRNTGVVPVRKGGFVGNFNAVQQNVVMQNQQQLVQNVVQKQMVPNFKNKQVQDLGVDQTFNPFNLPQPYFNPQNQQQEPQQVFGKQVFDEQQVVIQNNDFVRMPIVQRNNKFNVFNKRTVTRSVAGDFQGNLNQNFERKTFGCFDMVGKVRQNTQPRLQRTFNMNNNGLIEPRMLTGQFPQMEQGKVNKTPQTPMGFTVMKRINTEPKNFNGQQVQSPSFMNRKQLTGDVNMKVNQTVTKTRLLKTRNVIDTLNQLSKINNMY